MVGKNQAALAVCVQTKVIFPSKSSALPFLHELYTIRCFSAEIYEPSNDKTSNMACAPSKDSDQSDQSLRCPHVESLGPLLPIERTAKTDQIGRIPRLT